MLWSCLIGLTTIAAFAGTPLETPPAPPIEEPRKEKLKFNFQARARVEWRDNVYDFNNSVDSPTDDSWLLHRIRVGLEWEALPWFRVAIQGQDVRESFSDRPDIPNQMGAEGDDAFDLRLASIELGNPQHLSLKVGRQTLAYGDERLVGPLEWLNFSRTFDAAKLHWQQENWSLDAFVSSVVRIHESHFNVSDWLDGDNTRDQIFSGLYFSTTTIPIQRTDLYAFHLHEEGLTGGTDFLTLGTLMKGDPLKLRGWDYTMELVGQAGQVRGLQLRSYALHAEVGYNWLKMPWKPRLAFEYSHGSGDGDATDGKINTFQNLFPTNHPPYGLMDTLAWQNMHNIVLRLAAQPHPKVKTTLDLHGFWLADTGDAWYRTNGTTQVRPITPGASRQMGAELDFTVSAKLTKHLDMLVGYSHFFAGSYLNDTGAGDDARFAYMMLTLNY